MTGMCEIKSRVKMTLTASWRLGLVWLREGLKVEGIRARKE